MQPSKQSQQKQAVAQAALDYIAPHLQLNSVVGVGTGSTTNYFIDALASIKHRFAAAVASSEDTAQRLQQHGIQVVDLNSIDTLEFYVDGADECDSRLNLIKGGGAALTREKIIAAVAQQFICIADESKWVDVLGAFPLPVEVIPMARAYVARCLVALGGQPQWRQGIETDNGNSIIDVYGFSMVDPKALEQQINQIVGVVTHGIFANRKADVLLLGTNQGVDLKKV